MGGIEEIKIYENSICATFDHTKKEEVVATPQASSALRATKHLYVEPAVIVGGHIKRSLRYVVFFGTLAGAVYGFNNPEKLKKNVSAYMPKITIEAPAILK